MSQLDDLLARTSKPGRFVEHRRFVLSRDKAIEKQREFALRHPAQYVTEFVQAAVFAGATYIAIDVTPSSLLVAWVGGRPLQVDEVQNLLDYLFADRGDRELAHLVQLAVGVNAALQRSPRLLRIESGDGTRGLRMDVDRKGRAEGGTTDEAIAGTYLYAEFGGGWFARFSGSTYTEEQALVEQRCIYTPVPILLNGRAPFGYRASRHIEIFGAHRHRFFDDGERRGAFATRPFGERTDVRIVVGGVWVTSLELDELSVRPIVGVVCDDRLRKTADHGDIVRDRRFAEMLHATQPYVTEMLRQGNERYVPPKLPALPSERPEVGGGRVTVQPEPLPERMPMLAPRGTTDLDDLRRGDAPLFYVSPEHFAALAGPQTEPHAFPWRVLVLTEGEALTLSEALGSSVHRLTAPADLGFVQRMLHRDDRVREVVLEGSPTLTLRLHLGGHLPDWGHGREGVPWCVVHDDTTLATGVIRDDRIYTVIRRDLLEPGLALLPHPVRLPMVSLRVASDEPELSVEVVARAMQGAWRLAVPDDGPIDAMLLASLLGSMAVPQFARTDGRTHVAASLPVSWPDALRHVPLVHGPDGSLSLQGFLDLLGTDATFRVDDADSLRALEPLEARFGMGHLVHDSLRDKPLYGVARIGQRWVWLDGDAMWGLAAIEHLCFVGSCLSPRTHDDRWVEVERPAPMLVAARRVDVAPVPLEEAWQLLRERLMSVARARTWVAEAHSDVSTARTEAMGRLALLHLTEHLGDHDAPLFAPSDQGALRSLAELRTHRAARIAPRHGVQLAEPLTFLLTRDELAVVERSGDPRLRYDDGPAVWASLTRGDDGWLLRHEVRHAGLQGWLGLRLPHDPTSGVLLRSTDRLVALPDLDHRVPCHGLLWPREGEPVLREEQLRTVRLAALRLYQELVVLLQRRDSPERTEAARRYAFTYVWLARQRGDTGGTAEQLARLVDVHDADGKVWGPMEQWLDTPAERRPEVPEELLGTPMPPEEQAPQLPASSGRLLQRLDEALACPGLLVELLPRPWAGRAVQIDEARSNQGRVVVLLDETAPLVSAARSAPGPARELLLLELARQIAAWGEPRGLDVALAPVHQTLVAQRFDS
jgi:hypothetical protein